MGVKFLAKGNNSSRMPQWDLAITRQMPWHSAINVDYTTLLIAVCDRVTSHNPFSYCSAIVTESGGNTSYLYTYYSCQAT